MSLSNVTTETPGVTGQSVDLDGETYYRIANSQCMPEFYMSLVGASDHWMFVSSHGALTAGRRDPDNALFPYAADDQLSIARSQTGPITLIRETSQARLWEPFSDRATADSVQRNLYKTPLGNKLVFEEYSPDRDLAFRYRWTFSDKFGFVRTCWLSNRGNTACELELLDGLRNLLPYGVSSDFMMRFSNLANAYKKSELLDRTQIGLYYLSSIPTDRAEPSEGLKTTTVWQTGLTPSAVLLSTTQLMAFRKGRPISTEAERRGTAGAFLAEHHCRIEPGESIQWHMIAELEQDHCDVIELDQWLRSDPDLAARLTDDIDAGEQQLLRIVSSADGLQCGENVQRANRHLSNTVFNVMRGGVPLKDYQIDADDFRNHIRNFNRPLFNRQIKFLDELPTSLDLAELRRRVDGIGDPDLRRLVLEYLPLAFSRRHGDPTRPWNRFSIQLHAPDGSTNLNYQGNWRDIFQNWEALAVSFPKFTTAMISRFVNATTLDGYNPYRLTKGGFEWEEPTPEDPWANIGYWGDHQIIYLLKLLEWNQRIDAPAIDALLNESIFVHANVPYRIKDYEQIKIDPQNTILFDADRSRVISDRVEQIGADGKLLRDQDGQIVRVTLLEKLLTLSLAKLANFIPDGGIWLNTQRPEWNDANNALVGNGLSMVTACYLHRWFRFLHSWLSRHDCESFRLSKQVAECVHDISTVLAEPVDCLGPKSSASQRMRIVEALSRAGSRLRNQLYDVGLSGKQEELSRAACLELFDNARKHLAATIRNNQRPDGLFHSYNLIRFSDDGIEIEQLDTMLEGQVAVLSSGLLSGVEVIDILDALRESKLFRENQNSYLLYPDRQLACFLDKNEIASEQVSESSLFSQLLADGNRQIVRRDLRGGVHFSGRFRNSGDLRAELLRLPSQYRELVEEERTKLIQLFEDTFGHREFTGRSGTFFAYEGLGSIYWHMVSKLGLAVVEHFFQSIDDGESATTVEEIRAHYRSIREGIGAEKSPEQYGAFPTDPYSHTPENAGVKQPGMTGQVKEDILARFAELGVHVESGSLRFRFELFDDEELLSEAREFRFVNLAGDFEALFVPQDAFAFTLCQVPILCRSSSIDKVDVIYRDGPTQSFDGLVLDPATSDRLFSRTGEITRIECQFQST